MLFIKVSPLATKGLRGCYWSFPTGDRTVTQHVEELNRQIAEVQKQLTRIWEAVGRGAGMARQGEQNITQAEDIIQRAREALSVSSSSFISFYHIS